MGYRYSPPEKGSFERYQENAKNVIDNDECKLFFKEMEEAEKAAKWDALDETIGKKLQQ